MKVYIVEYYYEYDGGDFVLFSNRKEAEKEFEELVENRTGDGRVLSVWDSKTKETTNLKSDRRR